MATRQAESPQHFFLVGPQLDALAARPTKGMDLSSELRRLLVGYNRGLGAKAT